MPVGTLQDVTLDHFMFHPVTIFCILIVQSNILDRATNLCGEVGEKRDVHLLTLNREVLVKTLCGAFGVVDGGLVFLREETYTNREETLSLRLTD